MPELPEVEVTRRGLAVRLPGAQVLAARTGKPLRWPLGVAPETLTGQWLGQPARRGKYIWLPLLDAPDQPGHASPGLLLHLGMSGTLTVLDEAVPPGAHDHFDLHTTRGVLRLHDPRRFGAVVWSPALAQPPAARLLAPLGPEPLEPAFHAQGLHAALRGRRMAIKQALLAGDAVVGVGNIYCSEALHQAGIDPRTPAARLSLARCERLAAAIRDVLGRAVALGGSTLRDFHDAQGQAGAFQDAAQVYGRAGQPCRRCTGTVRRIVQGQRATFFCPGCQHR